MAAPNARKLLEFLRLVGKLKEVRRTGWVLRNVADPECVAGHMYRMGVMAMLIPEASGLDVNKCLKLALVHDISECIVGDITPFCGVSVDEKHRREEKAVEQLGALAGTAGLSITALYKEYAEQRTGEARMVKDIDRLDMLLQAFEYEQNENNPGRLQEFFDSTLHKLEHPWAKEIVREVCRQRLAQCRPEGSEASNIT